MRVEALDWLEWQDSDLRHLAPKAAVKRFSAKKALFLPFLVGFCIVSALLFPLFPPLQFVVVVKYRVKYESHPKTFTNSGGIFLSLDTVSLTLFGIKVKSLTDLVLNRTTHNFG